MSDAAAYSRAMSDFSDRLRRDARSLRHAAGLVAHMPPLKEKFLVLADAKDEEAKVLDGKGIRLTS